LIAYLMLSVLVYVRTYVVGEFKISYGRLGPTEIRALAILLNTAMYFFGLRTVDLNIGIAGGWAISVYDLFVAGIALLLLYFFITSAWLQARQLASSGE